jgi:hypothetical protein
MWRCGEAEMGSCSLVDGDGGGVGGDWRVATPELVKPPAVDPSTCFRFGIDCPSFGTVRQERHILIEEFGSEEI